MNPYDQAHQLANAPEARARNTSEYMRLRDTAYEDDTNRALLDEYKRLQFRVQARMASRRDDAGGREYAAAAAARRAFAVQSRCERLSAGGIPLSANAFGYLQDSRFTLPDIDLDMLTQG